MNDLIPLKTDDRKDGAALRDEALDRVKENAADRWREFAMIGIRILAAGKTPFTTDILWKMLDGHAMTHEPRAMGAVIREAQRKGIIKPHYTGWTQSTRKECHGRPVRVWVGV